MSRVLVGRTTGWVVSATAVAALLYCAGPALGALRKSPRPRAGASRACAYAHGSVRAASGSALRSAVVCLINHFRARRGLPRLARQWQLDAAAQDHSDSMVRRDVFAH